MGKKKKSKGLGIWLWLFAMTIGIYISFFGFFSLSGLMSLIAGIGNPISIVCYLAFLAIEMSAIYVLYLEFSYKKEFKKISLFYIWISFLILTVAASITKGNLFICPYFSTLTIIWTPYLLFSKQVKKSFTK